MGAGADIQLAIFALLAMTVMAMVQGTVVRRIRKTARVAASAAESLRGASAEAALDCIVSIDGEGVVCEWNDAAVRTFGYPREAALGTDLAALIIPPEQRARHHRGLARVAATGETRTLNRRMELMALHAGGREFPVELTITQVRDDPPMFTGFLRDISARRRHEERNERLAAIVKSSEDAIICRDLSGVVTAWNGGAESLYGYSADEAVGKPLADLLIPAAHADGMDAVTARMIAGDKSVAFETQRRRKDGAVIDVSLRAFAIRDVRGAIDGVCTSGHDITERHRREERERLDREGALWRARIATALADGDFTFWGQPVVEAATGATHHHELLLRMSLDGEVIAPHRFLPYAETCGLINEIDCFAVETGLEIAATTPVAINLSAKSLEYPGLIAHIKETLGDRPLAPNVTFEITETAAVENFEAARGLVDELTALGFGVALDDFGTGYGSFNYLRHLQVTELKIDTDFVRGLAEDPSDTRLVSSIVSVARNFEMRTVAEGVEDQPTLDRLRTLGVDYVQGYHVGRPAPMTLATATR